MLMRHSIMYTRSLTSLVNSRSLIPKLISRRQVSTAVSYDTTWKASSEISSSTVEVAEYMKLYSRDSIRANASIINQVSPLLRHHVTGWGDVHTFKVARIECAMTNFIFRCEKDQGPNKSVLVRVYGEGTDMLFSRDVERVTARALADAQFGPGILGEFGNGRIEEWIDSKNLSHLDIAKPEISQAVARKLGQLHSLPPPFPEQTPLIITKLHDWLDELQLLHASSTDDTAIESALSTSMENGGTGLDLAALHTEVARLTQLLPEGADGVLGKPPQVAMCHNDLHQGNLLLVDGSGEVELIDFEYAGLNYVAYDIANHFCESCIDYRKDGGDCMDWSLYPSPEAQSRFLAAYLGDPDAGSAEVKALRKEVARFSLAAHLVWGIWSLLSALNTNIDYDYVGYGTGRLRRYQQTRREILGE